MKRFHSLFLVLVLALVLAFPVSASSLSGLTVWEDVYYIDGTHYQLARDSSGASWYYVNGSLVPGAGVVFVNGYYYHVRGDGHLHVGGYTESATTYLPAGTYTYDSNGRMINPPSYPEDWEREWSSEWPFPTEPPETEPPTVPVTPSPGDDSVAFSPVWGFDLLNKALVFATDLWSTVMESTGLWPYFSAVVFLLLLGRFLLRPVFGSGISLGAGRSDRASDRRKED